jgi:agmatine deiminase
MNSAIGLLPEWAPLRAVLLAWPFPKGDWQDNYPQIVDCYWSMLTAISQQIPVICLLHPSLSAQAFHAECVRCDLIQNNIQILQNIEYNDTWIRDYGPLSTAQGYVAFTFNGWGGKYAADMDNAVAESLSHTLEATVKKYDFVCEGGGLETNGEYLLMNRDCIVDELRNAQIEALFAEVLGLKKCLWLQGVCLTGDDTDGHIDTIVRFANANTLVYAGPNPLHRDAAVLNHLHTQVLALAQQHQWQALALPSPEYNSLIDGRPLPCTYANFLIANQCVFAPIYGLKDDDEALRVLAQAFVGYKIIPVRCEALLEQHGSLHCATMQIAKLQT